ncbi:cupin domain-containing protein [Mycolicibacterium sp.]|uniref:cupin domain-containing protein n=1 Tax=Mycolicibacterium sp. TaxID=2320850 RepID=UPI003D0E83CD
MPGPDPRGEGVQQFVIASEDAPEHCAGYGFHVGITHLLPSASTDTIRHRAAEAVLVTAGQFTVELDGAPHTVGAGENFVIGPGVWHRFTNPTASPSSMVFVFGGRPEPITEIQRRG